MSRIIIDLREDGTISSLREETIETFTSPSGAERHEPSLTDRDLAWLDEKLGLAYAQYDTHNKNLEKQIETEREVATKEKKDLQDVHAQMANRLQKEKEDLAAAADEVIAEKIATISSLQNELAADREALAAPFRAQVEAAQAAEKAAREQMETLKRAGEMKDVALIEKNATIQMLSAKIPNVEEKAE